MEVCLAGLSRQVESVMEGMVRVQEVATCSSASVAEVSQSIEVFQKELHSD